MRLRWRFSILFASAILAFLLVADLVLIPLHERNGSNWTSWPNGLARMLELPGLIIAETFGARFRHRTGWMTWLMMLLVSFPLYALLGLFLRCIWLPRRRRATLAETPLTVTASPVNETTAVRVAPEYASPHPEASDAFLSRRGLFLAARRTAVAGVAGLGAYGFLWELRDLQVVRQSIPIRGLPLSLSGLRIIQLSDIHHGPWMSIAHVRQVVKQANELDGDLVLLTGDYVHQSDAYIEPVIRELQALRGRIGVIATLGNHDWWESGPLTMREFARREIPLIDNDRLFLTPNRKLERVLSADGLCLAGVGDLWEGSPNYKTALGGVPQSMPRILLSHNPDAAEDPELLEYRPRIDLMLSGHTHGGQVKFPLVGTPITPSKCGNRYVAGLCHGPLCPVYVNRGIGTTILPMRFGVRPEITVIELQSA